MVGEADHRPSAVVLSRASYAGRAKAIAAMPGGVRGRGIATAGHGGGSSSSSRRVGVRSDEGSSGRAAASVAAAPPRRKRGGLAVEFRQSGEHCVHRHRLGPAPGQATQPGVFSRVQASEPRTPRSRASPPRTGTGARALPRVAEHVTRRDERLPALERGGRRPGGFMGPERVKYVSIIDMGLLLLVLDVCTKRGCPPPGGARWHSRSRTSP